MRPLTFAFAFCALSTTALAQGRPFTPRLPCAAAAEIVARNGAAVLSTSPTTYDRYVRDRGFCEINETTRPAFVPTADTPQCFVGYRCKTFSRDSLGD
jgi:hypothetical protein